MEANTIHVPEQLPRSKPTVNVNPHEHGFVSKMQILIIKNINQFMGIQLLKLKRG